MDMSVLLPVHQGQVAWKNGFATQPFLFSAK